MDGARKQKEASTSAKGERSTVQTYSCRASLLLMKRKWAGSQMNPAEWHASTQDWPSWDTSSRRELRGGQADGAVTLDAHTRAVELGRATKSRLLLGLLLPAAPCLDRLVGMKGGSGAQKSWKGRKLPQHHISAIKYLKSIWSIFSWILFLNKHRLCKGEILFFLAVVVSRNLPERNTIQNLLPCLFAAGYVIYALLCNTKERLKEKK